MSPCLTVSHAFSFAGAKYWTDTTYKADYLESSSSSWQLREKKKEANLISIYLCLSNNIQPMFADKK